MSSPSDGESAASGAPAQTTKKKGDLKPSQAYAEARDYPVYRLSELMFGSLLAAYVLGFLSTAQDLMTPQAATQAVEQLSAPWDWMQLVCRHLVYLFISVSYAFVTAGIYISYHAGMLTLPGLPLPRLSWDFLVAILQAVAFGYSLVAPQWFPVALGLAMLVVFWRQWREFVALSNYLSKRYGPGKDEGRERGVTPFRLGLHRLLKQKKFLILSGWNRVDGRMAIGIGAACLAVGGGWTYEAYHDAIKQPNQDYWITIQTMAIGLAVIIKSHFVLLARSSFLEASEDDASMIAMDKAYDDLKSDLAGQKWKA